MKRRNMTPERPVLRYYGGKWRLAPWIIGFFPDHRVYVEPYGGAASVLLRKPPAQQEIYNDLDEEIVNVFRVLRDPGKAVELQKLLELTPYARAEYELAYTTSENAVEQARRTVSRSFMGYGGNAVTSPYKNGFRGHRAGSAGPATDWSRYPSCLPTFVKRISAVTIEHLPALTVLSRYDSPETLFYVDPPYVRETRRCNGDSYRFEMTSVEHEELAATLHKVVGMVILSGYKSNLYSSLYPDWKMVSRQSQTEKHASKDEYLWISPNAQAKLPQKARWLRLPHQNNCGAEHEIQTG